LILRELNVLFKQKLNTILAATVRVPTLPARKLLRPTQQPRGGFFYALIQAIHI